jgi:8-oxo-dGTP pyrophosphatase MutT (NUDIX family)
LAATLLLLREREAQLEVLMMRRRQELRFMGGMWVFPGGRVDPADCEPGTGTVVADAEVSIGATMQSLDGEPLPESLAQGVRVAACRETWGDAGLLLARHRDGRALSQDEVSELTAAHERTPEAQAGFGGLLKAHGLVLETSRLVYWSHWITPSYEARRFDTRFLAVATPGSQAPRCDSRESSEMAWLSPAAACAAAARGELLVAPPTLLTLEDLSESRDRHGGMHAMLEAERGRATPPVMPRVMIDGSTALVPLPWVPAYAQAPGEGRTPGTPYPPHLARRRSSLEFRRATVDG